MTAEEQAAEAVDKMAESEVVKPKAELAVVEKKSDIKLEDGLLQPTSIVEAKRIAEALLKSGCIPKTFDTVEKIMMAQQFLRQLRMQDIAGLPMVCFVNGSVSLHSQGPKAAVEDLIDEDQEWWFDKDYNEISFKNKNLHVEVFGYLYRVKRKGRENWVERTFTLEDAAAAGLLNKQGPWKQYRKRMLQCRARGWAHKDCFPDRLLGVGIAEYDHHATVVEGKLVETTQDQAPELAKRFKEEAS